MTRDLRRRSPWREPELWCGAAIVLLVWSALMLILGFRPFEHSPYDSYTLQAMAWRKGLLHLEKDYPWLELAIKDGNYYVSFPSVPALVMWALSFIFEYDTPNTIVTFLYLLTAYLGGYHLARRFRRRRASMVMALFLTLGNSLLSFSLDGGVWNQAQLMSLMLTTLCALGLTGSEPVMWGMGLGCLALSVGCRPFQAAYVPFGLWMLYVNLQSKRKTPAGRTLLRMVPYVIFPALVALALGWYNFARFGSPLEFGHNLLPEHTRNPDAPQLALKYIWQNIRNLMRLPWIEDGKIMFPRFNGFAFWLVNPMYVTFGACILIKLIRRRFDSTDAVLLFGILLSLGMTLTHKTLGGWQFGARYLCDMLPMMLLFELRSKKRHSGWETAACVLAIAVNVAGAIIFHRMS